MSAPHIGQKVSVGGTLCTIRALDIETGAAKVESADGYTVDVDVSAFDAEEAPTLPQAPALPQPPRRVRKTLHLITRLPGMARGHICDKCLSSLYKIQAEGELYVDREEEYETTDDLRRCDADKIIEGMTRDLINPPVPHFIDPLYPTLAAVACDTCAKPTTHTETKRCDDCWEVEHRLVGYLARGGAKAREIVNRALAQSARPRLPWGKKP